MAQRVDGGRLIEYGLTAGGEPGIDAEHGRHEGAGASEVGARLGPVALRQRDQDAAIRRAGQQPPGDADLEAQRGAVGGRGGGRQAGEQDDADR